MKKLLYFAIPLLFTACEDSENENNSTPEELLTQHEWKVDLISYDTNTNLEADDETQIAQYNETFHFHENGSLDYSKEDFNTTVSWEYIEEEDKVKIIGQLENGTVSIGQDQSQQFKIMKLTEGQFIMKIGTTESVPDFTLFKHLIPN